MNLDDLASFQRLDPQGRIAGINLLPERLAAGWQHGLELPLALNTEIECVVIAGMGESGAAAELLAAYALPLATVPVVALHDYDLPAWVRGPQALVVCLSQLGRTEETLAVFQQAIGRGCRVLAVTGGGKLAQQAQAAGALLRAPLDGMEAAPATASMFGVLLAILYRLKVLPDPRQDLENAWQALREQQTNLRPEIPVARNPAKRMAGQMVGREVVIYGAGFLAAAAHCWKMGLNGLSKALSQVEVLPDANHFSLVGLNHPEGLISQRIVLFLQAHSLHPRNQLRVNYTQQLYLAQAVNTDFLHASGEGRLAHLWTLVQFGDYTGYYLAMAYGEDPAPGRLLNDLKEEMATQNP